MNSISRDHLLAIALHPNYKSLNIIASPCFQNKFNDFDVIKALDESCKARNLPHEMNIEAKPQEMAENVNVLSDSDMDELEIQPKQSKESARSIYDDYKKFIDTPNKIVFENPMEYWNKSEFILLKNLAASIYCTQASSAEAERHNSAAGMMVTPTRNRLEGRTVENLVIYNEFLKNE